MLRRCAAYFSIIRSVTDIMMVVCIWVGVYYLRFYLDARDIKNFFDYGLVWLEYIPVLILLGLEYWRSRNMRIAEMLEVPVK